MLIGKKTIAIIAIVMIGITSFVILYPWRHERSHRAKLIAIPTIGTPQEAFREGYVYGYVVGKILSMKNPTGGLLKIRVKITYVGNASAPEELLVKPVLDNGLEVSLPPVMAKNILMRYQGDGRALLDLLFRGVISFDQDVPGRVWVTPSLLLNVSSEKPIVVHRNSSVITTIFVKPANLSLVEREIACSLLNARLSRIGINGPISIDFKLFNAATGKPASHIWKKTPSGTIMGPLVLISWPISIPAIQVYYIACIYNMTSMGGIHGG